MALYLVGCAPLHSGWVPRRRPPSRTEETLGPPTAAQEADVQIALGRAAEQRGEFGEAMAAYRAALERDRRRADACVRLAVIHDRQGEFGESAGWYRRALE